MDTETVVPASGSAVSGDPPEAPTLQQYPRLQEAFDVFNRELFAGELTPCLITLQRRRQSFGYYSPGVFINAHAALADEIALNPTCFAARAIEENLAELVRHMCTHWIHLHGKQGREGYYNKAWAKKMRSLGLIPQGDGKGETGQRVTLQIDLEGKFLEVCQKLVGSGFNLPWIDRYPDEETLEAVLAESRVRAIEEAKRGVRFGEAPAQEPDMFATDVPSIDSAGGLVPSAAQAVVETIDKRESPEHDGHREPLLFHPAETIYEAMTEQGVQFPKAPAKKKRSQKASYVCPNCETTVWGKHKLRVSCMDCNTQMCESTPKNSPSAAAQEPAQETKGSNKEQRRRGSKTDGANNAHADGGSS